MPPELEKKEEEEIIPVGDGVEEEEEKEELEDELEKEELDEEEEEERLGAGEDDEEGDEKRSKRRDERKSRRQRQKDARDRDKTELNFLRGRNDQLERQFSNLDARVGQSETAQIDVRINDVKSKIKLADQVITKAIDQSDGAAVVEAQGIRDNLRDNLNQLSTAKNYMTQQRQAPQQQPPVDPRLVHHAGAWMQDHSWWNPNGGDEDSIRVSELDAQMVREGLDPTTPEYWDELSDRVEEAMPHRFEGNGDARTQRKKGKRKPSGPTMSVSGRERPLKKNEVYISPDRKEAMIEAGVWEDPELRQKYLKQYAKYDAENRA